MRYAPTRARAERRGQRGYLLMVVLALLFGVGMYGLLGPLDPAQARQREAAATAQALREAKEAVLAYLVSGDTLGRLPCPEDTTRIGTPYEGLVPSGCYTLPTELIIGRIAWRSLGAGELLDGRGETLWYAVSPAYRNLPLNSNTPGDLSVDGQGDIVAVIFSPGAPQGAQMARGIPVSTAKPAAAEYLDGTNGDGDFAFASSGAGINDRLITITRQEYRTAMEKFVLGKIRGADTSAGLRAYFKSHGDFPMLLNDIDSTSYFTADDQAFLHNNGWFGLITYVRVPNTLASLSFITSGTFLRVAPCSIDPCP